MKCWYIVYAYLYRTRASQPVSWSRHCTVLKDEHPVQWLIRMRKEFPHLDHDLLFFEEIPEDVYNEAHAAELGY